MTTILAVRVGDETVLAGDGQVTLGNAVIKQSARKIRVITSKKNREKTLAGFAGTAADAFALMERLESKLEKHPDQIQRACVELARDWRSDKYLRRLEATLIVAGKKEMFIVSGSGDVIAPENGIAAIGSGGNYALSAAKALKDYDASINAEEIARRAMVIAAELCIYTNSSIVMEKI